MPAYVVKPPPPEPGRPAAVRRARREAERQLEWAEAYLAAAEGLDTGDAGHGLEARRLRLEVGRLRQSLRRPRLL